MELSKTETVNNENDNKNIQNFNKTYIEFCTELKDLFPEYSQLLNESIDVSNKDNDYIDNFMTNVRPHILKISNKNHNIFNSEIYLINNIDFSKIWNSNISNKTKNAIWKYLHTLYLLGNTINPQKNDELNNVLSSVNNNDTLSKLSQQSQAMINIIKNLENDDYNECEEINNSDESNNNSDESNNNFDSIFGDSKIGELANELAGEINIEDLGITDEMNENPGKLLETLMSGGNSNNLMNMIQTVGNKIQNKISSGQVNETQLLSEAQSMMGMLGNNDLLSNMMSGMSNMNKPNKTQERLRRKLEKKKKGNNNE